MADAPRIGSGARYSIANAPRPDQLLSMLVTRVPGGRTSNRILDHLRAADELILGEIEELAAGAVNVAHESMGDVARCAALDGHPFGDSGTRGVLTLATEPAERGARHGCLGLCVGSGQGSPSCSSGREHGPSS